MNRLFCILLALVCFASTSNAQVPDTLLCDYPDRDTREAELLTWFGNKDYLENYFLENKIRKPDEVVNSFSQVSK